MFQIEEGKIYPKKIHSKSLIRFQDCDPLKHLNNAKYFDYFFNAREDHVAEIYKFDYNDYFEHNHTSWVVYNHQIAYISSAKVSEWVTIISSIVYFNEDTLVTEYVMTDEHQQELKAVLWTTSKYIDVRLGKKTVHPPEVMRFFELVCLDGINFEHSNLNLRIKQIKNELKAGTFVEKEI